MADNIKATPEFRSNSFIVEQLSDQNNEKISFTTTNHNEASFNNLVNNNHNNNNNNTKSLLHSNYNDIDTPNLLLPANLLVTNLLTSYKNSATAAPVITVIQTSQIPDKLPSPINRNGTTDYCRPPPSKKFGHPCNCFPAPPVQYPAFLWDPSTNKCLTASYTKPRLLKECSRNNPCGHPDLICDQRKQRCNCRSSLHLYYESNRTLGCVPLDLVGRECKRGQFWNSKTNACQRAFDINELQSSFQPVLSATQFSFVSIVLLWILLLILILTAKLRKLKSIHTVRRQSMSGHRRIRHDATTASQWLHPFITAVNGHHHLHSQTVDRQSLSMSVDDPSAVDSEVFLSNTGQRAHGIISNSNFTSSSQSLNNPPPKFEEIYPHTQNHPSWSEDLPSYEEAMKMQDQHSNCPDNDYNPVAGAVKVFMNEAEYQSFPP